MSLSKFQGRAEQGGQRVKVGYSTSDAVFTRTYPYATLSVYEPGTTTLATIYQDEDGLIAESNPLTADRDGEFEFWSAGGTHDIHVGGSVVPVPFTMTEVTSVVPEGVVLNGRRVFNVLSYGAKGDGVNDDTSAVQAAVTAAGSASNGGMVYFPPTDQYATYRITAPIYVTGNVKLYGDKGNGAGSNESWVSMGDINQDMFVMQGDVWEVRELKFGHYVGHGGTVTSVGTDTITFDTLTGVTVSSPINATQLVEGFTPAAINNYYTTGTNVYRMSQIDSGVTTATQVSSITHTSGSVKWGGITYTFVTSGTTYTAGNFGWGQQWYFAGVTGTTLTGVVPAPDQSTYATPAAMVAAVGSISAVSGGRGYFSSIEHKSAADNTKAFVYAENGNDGKIQGNWFGSAYGAAIRRGTAYQGGTWALNTFDLGKYGIQGHFRNARIRDNHFYGLTRAGIQVTSGTGPSIDDNTFDHNNVDIDSYETSYGGGSSLPGAVSGMSISGNKSMDSQQFLRMTGTAHTQVAGNMIYRTHRSPFYLANSSYNLFSGNHVIGVGESQAASGEKYPYFEGLGNISKNWFLDNVITFVNPGQYSDYIFEGSGFTSYSTDCVFQGNIIEMAGATNFVSPFAHTTYLRATRSREQWAHTVGWQPNSGTPIPIGGFVSASVNIPGVSIGDMVQVSLDNNTTAGVVLTGEVTSADWVTVTLFNGSAAGVTFSTTGNLRVLVSEF